MSDDRGWVYQDDDSAIVYRASSLGKCIRGLVAARMGIKDQPRPQVIQDAMDVSSGLEGKVVDYLDNEGYEIVYTQNAREIHFDHLGSAKHIILRGHVDAIVSKNNRTYVAEIKCVSEKSYEKYDKQGITAFGRLAEAYQWQADIYAHAAALPVLYVVGKKVDGKITEVSIDDHVIKYEIADIAERLRLVEGNYLTDNYPDCDRGCGSYDEYWHIHEQKEEDVREDSEVAAWLRELRILRDQDIASEKRQKEIKKLLENVEPATYIGAGIKGAIVEIKGRKTVSTAKVKKLYPEIAEECTVIGKPYTRIDVDWYSEQGDSGDRAEQ